MGEFLPVKASQGTTSRPAEDPKIIYFEPAGRIHSIHRTLLGYPPPGYTFVTTQTRWDILLAPMIRTDLVYFHLHRLARKALPIHLVKSRLERFTKKRPQSSALTYSWGHLVLRREPWVLEMEWVHQLTDYRIRDFLRYKRFIEATLASPYCRKIICWSEFNRRHIEANLDTASFGGKLVVVPWAVPAKRFTKHFDDSSVNLLFVGSANTPGEFDEKGGRVLIESFRLLRERYPNVRLTIRSDVPQEIKQVCARIPGMRLMERTLPPQELEGEFASADIFVLPGHTYYTVFYEAMSYELPIVTTDIHANGELVEDGTNGLLIRRSNRVQYYARNLLPDFDAPGYRSAVRQPDPAMVQELTAKLSILIDNSDLRRRMGRAGRWQVEEGKFSIRNRNEKLGNLLDGMLGGSD